MIAPIKAARIPKSEVLAVTGRQPGQVCRWLNGHPMPATPHKPDGLRTAPNAVGYAGPLITDGVL